MGQDKTFTGIIRRVRTKLLGWKEKFLSQAVKEILIKAGMSVFQLPKTLCRDLNSMMSKLFWGHQGNVLKVAWMSLS